MHPRPEDDSLFLALGGPWLEEEEEDDGVEEDTPDWD